MFPPGCFNKFLGDICVPETMNLKSNDRGCTAPCHKKKTHFIGGCPTRCLMRIATVQRSSCKSRTPKKKFPTSISATCSEDTKTRDVNRHDICIYIYIYCIYQIALQDIITLFRGYVGCVDLSSRVSNSFSRPSRLPRHCMPKKATPPVAKLLLGLRGIPDQAHEVGLNRNQFEDKRIDSKRITRLMLMSIFILCHQLAFQTTTNDIQ